MNRVRIGTMMLMLMLLLRRLRSVIAAGLASLAALAASPAIAHDVPPSVMMLDIGRSEIVVDLELPLSELGSAMSLPLAATPAATLGTYRADVQRYVEPRLALHTPDGRAYQPVARAYALKTTSNQNWTGNDWLVVRTRFEAPDGQPTDAFTIDDTAIIERVVSHEALIYVRRDLRNGLIGDAPTLVSTAGYGHTRISIDGSGGSWSQGARHLFVLGLHHIAKGTDHILFLLALLLPAPLVARAGRWAERKRAGASLRRVAGVVTGFTLGHTLSLGLAAAGWVHAPTRLVESLIAVSILVSCAHAVRPIFAGREAWVAAGFGLVHGLAFAEVLSGLDFDATTLALSLVSFNLGIEAMQLLIIAAALPLLLVLSRTSARYRPVRLSCAGLAAVCALSWLIERAAGIENPLRRAIADLSFSDPPWLVAALGIAASIGFVLRYGMRTSRQPERVQASLKR